MAVYQPLPRIENDFLEDKTLRDHYLDGAKTLRGVTIMAMGFLDKTLGSGLHMIQTEADNFVQNHLLKQISWTTTRLANPNREVVFRDTDEKLEACLEIALVDKVAKSDVKGKTRERVHFQCKETCGKAPEHKHDYRTDDGKESGNGSYSYCVCCAETDDDVNKLGEDGERKPIALPQETNRIWTLWERLVWGVMHQSKKGEHKDKVDKLVDELAMLYGDYTVKKHGGSGGGGGGGGEPYFTYTYQMPKVSPRRFVALYKNRCYHSSNGTPDRDLDRYANCGMGDTDAFKVNYGACPGLMNILYKWEEIIKGQKPGDLNKWWAEASMGSMLTGRRVRGFLTLGGEAASKVEKGKEPPVLLSAVEAWCEASAVSGAARQHARFKAMVNDFLSINAGVLDDTQKMRARMLMDHYTEAFTLMEHDANAKWATKEVLMNNSIHYDRRMAEILSNLSETAVNDTSIAANVGGLGSFTQAGLIQSGTGGAGNVSRVQKDFATWFQDKDPNGNAGRILAEAEEARPANDPVARASAGIP